MWAQSPVKLVVVIWSCCYNRSMTDKITDEFTDKKDKIILAALPHIMFDGWTKATLAKASEDAGFGADMALALFPSGVCDALVHFSDWADREMLQVLGSSAPEEMRVRDRVITALIARYEALSPYKDAVRQSASYWSVPSRTLQGGRMVWKTADVIWNWAGDTATDYNRYTKRGLLSGVITSTTLAWLNDETEDMLDTKRFLDRRIENVMKIGGLVGKFKGVKSKFSRKTASS